MMRKLEIVVILLIIIVMLACLGLEAPLDVGLALIIGWARFLYRGMPHVTVNPVGVLTALLCLIVLTAGLHSLLSWLRRQSSAPTTEPSEPAVHPWSLRWTVSLVALVVLMFVAGTAGVGVAHQTGWLLTAPDPLIRSGTFVNAALRIRTENSLRQMALALHNYQESHGSFPPGGTFDPRGAGLHGWQTALLPFVEEEKLYQQVKLAEPWSHPDNRSAFQTIVHVYLGPRTDPQRNESGYALSYYAGNARVLGGDVPMTLKMITDGTSNTVLLGEVGADFKPWGNPANWRDPGLGINRTPNGFGSSSREGASFAFADGSVRRFSNDTDPVLLRALSTPAGGEKLPEGY